MAEDSDIEEVLTEPLLNPALVQKAATFVRNEAPSVHPIFGGLPHPPDKEVFQFPTHLKFSVIPSEYRLRDRHYENTDISIAHIWRWRFETTSEQHSESI